MSELDGEFFSFAHVVAMGRRKMVLAPEPKPGKKPKEYEVFVRLMSGSSFTLAGGLSRKAAGKALAAKVHDMAEQTGTTMLTTEDAAVPFHHVARVFVDRNGNSHVAMMEDSSGAQYEVLSGSQQQCTLAMQQIASAILTTLAEEDEE